MSEGTYPIPLRRRSRMKRALRFPMFLLQYRRAGASWRSAWRLTHWIIWYPNT